MNKRVRSVLIAGTALVAAGAVGTIWATSSAAAQSRYVTAVATTGDVSQSYLATGTISRQNLVEAGFDVTGTVKQVEVGVGDTVAAGDVLATLDTTALKLALLNAETDLAAAKATLYAAQHPSSSSSSSRGSSSSRSSGPGKGSGGSTSLPSGITATDAATLYEAIAALNVATLKWSNPDDPTTCDLIYAALLDANEAETTDPVTDDPDESDDSGTGSTDTDEGADSSSADEDSSTPEESDEDSTSTGEPDDSGDTDQTTADDDSADDDSADDGEVDQLALVVDDITVDDIVACGQAREDLVLANAVLTDYYQQLITTGTITTDEDSDDPTTASTTATTSSSSGSSKSGSSSSSTSVSARAVASAKADVLRAQQASDAAETALENAELVAPITGTVGAISLSVGASSSGGAVTIVGEGTALVRFEAPLGTRKLLSQGMTATVTSAGTTDSLTGTVSQIAILETSGTAGDNPTYTTTIAVEDPGLLLKAGAQAGVEIVTGTASGVVTVPTSAVTPTGSGTGTVAVVEVASSDTAAIVTVSTGAVGGGRVEITNGLTEGQLVVLSDRTTSIESLTASSTTSTRRIAGGFALPR